MKIILKLPGSQLFKPKTDFFGVTFVSTFLDYWAANVEADARQASDLVTKLKALPGVETAYIKPDDALPA